MSIRAFVLAILLALFTLPVFAESIDINTADAATLAALDGVGEVKAQAIIAYRNEHGPFKSLEDLANVTGIGAKIIDDNRDRISVGKKTEEAPGM
jgi:competence protein ComEA